MRQKNALFRAGFPEGDTVREAVFCRLLSRRVRIAAPAARILDLSAIVL